MNFKSLQRRAKQLIDRRGGTDSLKADAEELKDIAKGAVASLTPSGDPGRQGPRHARKSARARH
jgi:hypothetical protein